MCEDSTSLEKGYMCKLCVRIEGKAGWDSAQELCEELCVRTWYLWEFV